MSSLNFQCIIPLYYAFVKRFLNFFEKIILFAFYPKSRSKNCLIYHIYKPYFLYYNIFAAKYTYGTHQSYDDHSPLVWLLETLWQENRHVGAWRFFFSIKVLTTRIFYDIIMISQIKRGYTLCKKRFLLTRKTVWQFFC